MALVLNGVSVQAAAADHRCSAASTTASSPGDYCADSCAQRLLCPHCCSLQELSALSSCGRLQLRRTDRTARSARSAALLAGSQQACKWTDPHVARLCAADILRVVIVMAIRPDAASAPERYCR
ncbi:hypothetical protein MTO96_013949 [Rhipicephalus appendiculatus]